MSTSKLYLIPVDLGNKDLDYSIPKFNQSLISDLDCFACENLRSARRFLINSGLPSPIPESIKFIEVRNDDSTDALQECMQELSSGRSIGFLSEAGNPCIADPGESLVQKCHNKGIQVVPLVGPSSILLALIGSGLNAENFAFTGYIDQKNPNRTNQLKDLIRRAAKQTQIFMETPYRNNQIFEEILKNSPDHLSLCVAVDLTTETEAIICKSVADWKNSSAPNIHKRPAIFAIGV